MKKFSTTRRSTLKGLGAMSAMTIIGVKGAWGKESHSSAPMSDNRKTIFQKVQQTPFIDTHEHLIEEKDRFANTRHPQVRVTADDWTMILSHYFDSDMITAGMPKEDLDRFFSPDINPMRKWKLVEPFWPFIKNTGYGQNVQITIRELYGVDELSAKTIPQVQAGYEKIRRPGFYKYILRDLSNIKSCQVNSLEGRPFKESAQPLLLMQDMSIVGMFTGAHWGNLAGPQFEKFSGPTGISVSSLQDWYRVIDWWFDKYSKYAVAVKSQNAYARDIDYDNVPAEKAEKVFKKRLAKENISAEENKALEDHLFWYAVRKATKKNLPVKLHTGYYAGHNYMPLSRLTKNPGSVTALCKNALQTRFVFMHICYPYYEELISVAKHYANAYVDMCWSWIINPLAAKDFLKKYIVTAPANKLLTFGGDYIPVELVLGHAVIARQGIAQALSELVEEEWLTLQDALDLVDPIMHENAEHIFNLAEKENALKNARWSKA
ncbi:MAG: amidohydrolase family protein [Calditrichaeota bacterium]|nr:amidohydrolase family protein [Calditrichota bacterium]